MELQREIERLRKSIVSEGLSFEQVEYKIESLKSEISNMRKMLYWFVFICVFF